MSIRLIAIDLDGTLLNSRSEISRANRRALLRTAECGIHLVIVTGRRVHSAQPFVKQIPGPVALIASNGALIVSPSGEVIHRDFLPAAIAREALESTREFRPYAVAIFDKAGRGQLLMENTAVLDGPLGGYLKNWPDCLLQVPNLAEAVRADPVQVMFGGPPGRIEAVEPLLRAAPVAESFHLTWTKYLTRNVSILDVMNKGCSKGRALKLWAERCGAKPTEVMAIGDNYNDLEMLQFSGRPVVMGNGSLGLAREGWFVTRTNDEDGVAAAIETTILNADR